MRKIDFKNTRDMSNLDVENAYKEMFAKFGKNFEKQYYKIMQKANEINANATSFEARKATMDIIDSISRCFNNIALDTNHFWEVVGEK